MSTTVLSFIGTYNYLVVIKTTNYVLHVFKALLDLLAVITESTDPTFYSHQQMSWKRNGESSLVSTFYLFIENFFFLSSEPPLNLH